MGNSYTIQRLLHKSFTEHTNRDAVLYAGKTFSYHQLDEKAEHYAAVINEKAPDGQIIAVMMEDTFETICAILAVVKLGKCFLPINVEYPVSTITHMLSVHPGMVLTDSSGKRILDSLEVFIPYVDCTTTDIQVQERVGFNTSCEEQSGLYMYFTSGTTGKPKGILGKNISLYHFILWEIKQFQMKKDFFFSQFTPVCHDPFLRDVFTPLALGACIAIPDSKQEIINGLKLKDFIQNQNISVIHCTPSLFRILLQSGTLLHADFPKLRYILLAGERLDSLLLEPWYDVFGGRIQIVNLYGPTETTLAKLFYCVSPGDTRLNSIPIGKPMKGAQALLLDSQMKLCTQSQVGEIYIRTPYMSLGYYEDESLTASRFIKNPFSSNGDPDDLIFKTGDTGRMLSNGNIEYIGRVDRQIKIRGFRVELDAIETVLGTHTSVTSCAVKHFETDTSLLIVGYYTADTNLTNAELSSFMKGQLPDYMCPVGFVQLEQLPVTRNNKIDYKALSLPDHFSDTDYVQPDTDMEQEVEKIWCETLRRKRFSVIEDFMQGGGNSLNTMFMINRVKESFGYELPIGRVFSGVTIRQLAQEIESYKEQRGSANMMDVENKVIELTKMDARYIRVTTSENSWNVLFAESENTNQILQAIQTEFDSSLHPHFICKINDRAVILPDEIDYCDKEFEGLLTLKEGSNVKDMEKECSRLLSENAIIEESITQSSPAVKRALSVAQIVRNYIPETNGTLFKISGMMDRNALNNAFRAVLQNESLMRCTLTSDTEWKEYAEVPEIRVPVLDLIGYSNQCQEEMIRTVLIPKFYHVSYPKHHALQWRAALIRLNYAESIFCLSANHLIFDGFSRHVFEDELMRQYKLYLKGEQETREKKHTYFTYMEEVNKTAGLEKNKDWLVSTDAFTSLCRKLRKKIKDEKAQVQKVKISMEPIFCRYPEVARDEIMARTAYHVFIHTMAAFFETNSIPFVTISDGRRRGQLNCYDCIGEFIDYIPFIGIAGTDLNYKEYSDYLSQVEREGISVLESFGGLTREMRLFQFMRNIPIVYNYQHYVMNEATGKGDYFSEFTELEMEKIINFIVRPGNDTMEIIVVAPVRLESLQECAKDADKALILLQSERK